MYHILIVDDESTERDGIEFLIQQNAFPFQIQKACNGQEAYEFLRSRSFDVLITDIKMPFMDGLELSEKARDLYPDTIILVSSAYDDFAFMRKAIKVKVEDYILKPVIVSDFVRIMTHVITLLDERSKKLEKHKEMMEKYKDATPFQKEKLILKLLEKEQGMEGREDSENPDAISDKKAIADAVAFIENNYQKDIGLEWVARKVYLSPGYFSSLFKKETGKSVIQYITLCRLENAKKLLTETNMKVVDVCQKVGYNNASYFGLLFRKYFGVTPNQIREQGGFHY